MYWRSGMALGFFILGPCTRMSCQIGVPSILGGSQNLVMRKSDWQITVILFSKLYCLFSLL